MKQICQMYAHEKICKLESYVDEKIDELKRRYELEPQVENKS